jgi:heat shock protein HtpX
MVDYVDTSPPSRQFLPRLNLFVRIPLAFLTIGLIEVAFFIGILIVTLWGPVLAGCALAMYLPLRALSRDRELAADRSAALWLGRPALLAATLVKVHGQRDQIPRTDLRASGLAPLGLVAGRGELPGWLASHPPLDRRLAQLDQLTRLLR